MAGGRQPQEFIVQGGEIHTVDFLRICRIFLDLESPTLNSHGGAQLELLSSLGSTIIIKLSLLDEVFHSFLRRIDVSRLFGRERIGFGAEWLVWEGGDCTSTSKG